MIDTDGKRYGFMRDVEADLFDRLLYRIKTEFGNISFLEVGVFAAGTVRGVYRRGTELGCQVRAVGVDFEKYRPNPTPAPDYVFYSGDSMDMFREIPEGTKFGLCFIDGCHCVNHAMADFLNYSPFVVKGGYALFHDTALPTELGLQKQEEWPQDHSYAGKPSSVLGVREGLKKLGLLQGYRKDWQLIEDLPSDSGLMGMHLFKKTEEL